MLKMIKVYGAKNIFGLVAGIVLCFALVVSGCTKERIIVLPASTTTVKATTTTAEKVTTTTEEEIAVEDLFLATIKSSSNIDLYFSDDQLIGLAKSSCEGFDSGLTKDDIIQVIFEVGTEYGLTDQQMIDLAGVVGAGVAAFCPYNSYLID